MNTNLYRPHRQSCRRNQRGVILVITLVSLVVLLLTAIALFRSVDTGTMIAGNLALRQAAVAASDRAVAEAATALTTRQNSSTANMWVTQAHPINNTDASISYYSNVDTTLNLTAASTWAANGPSTDLNAADGGGNQTQYLIQRMCRDANALPLETNCLLNFVDKDNDSKKTGLPPPERPKNSVVYRITVRVSGPKNTVSYTQAFVN